MKEKVNCLLLKRSIHLKDCEPLLHSSNCKICPVKNLIETNLSKASKENKTSYFIKNSKKKTTKNKAPVSSIKSPKTDRMGLAEETRKKYKWEFLRRNKDYISDYLKYRDEEWGPIEIIMKWPCAVGLDRKLFDPNNSNPGFEVGKDLEKMYVWDPPIQTWLIQRNPINNKAVSLFPPGTEIDGKKFKHWTIYYKGTKTLDALSQDNYPDYLQMGIRILPFYQTTQYIKTFMKEFKKQLDLLLKAQRSITDYKKANRPRLNLYDEYLEVYDLHEKKKWTFEKIAKKMFPREFSDPSTLGEKSREQNPENAIKKVQYYYREAKRMINGGWEWI